MLVFFRARLGLLAIAIAVVIGFVVTDVVAAPGSAMAAPLRANEVLSTTPEPVNAALSSPTDNAPAIVSPRPTHDRPVSAVPVNWTPHILNGRTLDSAQVGNTMVVGGSFTQVAPSSGSPVLNRTSVVAFSAINGAINTGFAPSVSNGEVRTVEPGPTAGTVFLGGSFQGVNGATRKVVLVNVETGQLVPGFTAPAMNGAVNDIQLVGNRLYVGGLFTTVGGQPNGGLVALNATTGARETFLSVALTENQNYTGQPGQAQAGVGAKAIVVRPQGDQMAVIGNFRKADGLERRQMVLIDLTGPTAVVRADWKTNRLAPACFSNAFDTYVRGVNVAPDGSYYNVVATGGPNPGTLCDTITRWDPFATGQDVQPQWIDDTGGDTLLSVASSGAAIYTGGHQRWMNNHGGRDNPAAGSVPRPGLGAVDVQSGLPIAWNPGRNPRGIGAESMYVSDSGLWVGSDTEQIGNYSYKRPRLAFFPVSTGVPLGDGDTGALPGNVYVSANPAVAGVGEALYRVNAGGASIPSLDDGPAWLADDGVTNPLRNSGSNTAGYSADGRAVDGTVPSSTPAQIFDTERWDPSDGEEMAWEFPVPSGQEVVVRIYLANRCDCTVQPGQRSFDVELENQTVLDNYDITADVGSQVGTMKDYTVTSDGAINLRWKHEVENSLVNGIEILKTVPVTEPEDPEASTLSRVWFTGGAVEEPAAAAPAGDIDWTTVRGAVAIDDVLFYGTSSGDLMKRSFDGVTYGSAKVVDPYNDAYWSNVNTGSGQTFRGAKPSFYNNIPTLTGMAYNDGQLFYTQSGSNRVSSRKFSPDGGVMMQEVVQIPVFSSSSLGGIFFDENAENLYFVTSSDGALSRIAWNGATTVGNATVVSGPSLDGMDWRARAVFIADGPVPVPNVVPVAVASAECGLLDCVFDGSGSSDSDGSIVSYSWNFGDGSAPVEGVKPSHVYGAAGSYTATLTVTDDKGATGSATVDVQVVSNRAPVAVIGVPSCDLVACSFDGSGSSDPDAGDSVVSSSWDFGDGSAPVEGVAPAHVYGVAGSYTVTLTVADQSGATGSVTYELVVDDGSAPVLVAPTLVGQTAVVRQQLATSAVTVPADVQAGDLLVLFVTTNTDGAGVGPAGIGDWQLKKRVLSGTLAVSVFTKIAAGSESGQSVTMTWPGAYRTDLTMLAYRGVGEQGVEVLESAVATNTATYTTPTVTVPGEQRVALSFWADRSSSTTAWTAPAGVDVVSTQVGTGGGRVSTLLTSQLVGAGQYGGLAATINAPSARGTALSLLIAPAVTP